jgi:hypothetical protein
LPRPKVDAGRRRRRRLRIVYGTFIRALWRARSNQAVTVFHILLSAFCWLGLASLVAGMLLGIGESIVDFWQVFLAKE